MPSTSKSLAREIANLPLVLAPAAITADELALILGTYLPDPAFVIDVESGLLVAGNPRFLELVGVRLEDAQREAVPFDQLVVPADRPLFSAWRAAEHAPGSSFELRLRLGEGREAPVEISLVSFRWIRRVYLLGFVRPAQSVKELERKWAHEIEEQKRRTMEAVKSSVRIYQITEKIERTLALTKTLLNTENPEQLFQVAARILTSEGLNYSDVTILMLRENCLEVRHSTRPGAHGRFPLSESNKYAHFVRRNFSDAGLSQEEMLVPLRSRENFLGILEVSLLERERIFFEDLRIVSEWQRNVLLTIGDVIALHLDNLRLYGEVKRQSILDPLTGVFNRNYFVSQLSAEMNRCSRNGRPLSLIFIDVDEFKFINDRHGHLQGDKVLKELGAIFIKNLREEDCVCRYGGDEFVILLPEVDTERCQKIADKLRLAVRDHRFYSIDSPETTLPISISMGTSSLQNGQNEDLFLESADAALYRAKKLGRNRCEAATSSPPAPSAPPSPAS